MWSSSNVMVTHLFLCCTGAPASGPGKGRYMWIKCRPNGQNANCIKQRGPLQDLPGLPDRLPASAVKDLYV